MRKITFSEMLFKKDVGRWLTPIVCLLFLLSGQMMFAQANTYSFAQSAGTYVPITGGTLVTSTTNYAVSLDSYVSPQQTFPSPFNFGGVNYNNFYVTSNGQIGLGTTAPSGFNYRPLTNSTGSNVFITPFSADMAAAATGLTEIRWEQVGNEVVIQWTNFRRYNKTEAFSFQARLNTTTGVIKYVYSGTPPYAATTDYQPHVGIKSATGNYMIATVGAAGSWNSPVVITTGATDSSIATFNGPVGFTDGLTYTFSPPTCIAPSGLNLTALGSTTATIAWTPSSTGASGGYDYYYGTTNTPPVAPTASVAAGQTSVALTGLTSGTPYYFWVRSNCGGGDLSIWSPVFSFSTPCDPVALPYSENFESVTTPALPTCTSAQNVGTGNNWATYSPAANGFTTKTLSYLYHSSNAANAWFYTRSVNLTAGVSYTISYKYGNNGGTTYVEKMKVAYGTMPVASSMTTVLADHPNIVNNVTPIINSVNFTPAVSGVYYIGFNVYSIADRNRLFVDDIMLDVTPSCLPPTGLQSSAVTATTATVMWTPPATAPAGGYEYYHATTNTAPTGATAGTAIAGTTLNLTGLTANSPQYVWVRSNCGGGILSDWSLALNFSTPCAEYAAPFSEQFSGGAIPTCWSTTSSNTVANGLWKFAGAVDYDPGNTRPLGTFAWVDGSDPSNINNVTLLSPFIDLSALTVPELVFDMFSNNANTYPNNIFTVDVYDGTVWTNVYTNNTSDDEWRTISIPLSAYAGTTIQIRFVVDKTAAPSGFAFYNDIALDNVIVQETPTCFPPDDIIISGVTKNAASLAWTAPATAPSDGYEIYYSDVDTAPTAGTLGNASSAGLTADLTGLDPSTTYYVWMRGTCGAVDGDSVWTEMVSFTTLCDYPEITGTTDATICGEGEAELSATAPVGAVINWYAAETGGVLAGTGATFTTPTITETTDFYVSSGTVTADEDITLGAGASTSSSGGLSPYYHGWGGVKTQFIIRASELQAAGIYAGPINSVSFTITTLGTATLNNFALSMGSTTQNVATTTHIDGLTPVYSNAAQALTMGLNTYTFTTPFVWDGSSNIVVQTCYSNVNTGGTSSAVQYDAPGFTSATYTYADNKTAAQVCAATTGTVDGSGGTGTATGRPKMIFNATLICESPRTAVTANVTTAPEIEVDVTESTICEGESTDISVESDNTGYAYVWMPGNLAGAMQTVSPTETTTYTVTATDETTGCVTVETITVTVNPLPVISTPIDDAEVCEGGVQALTFVAGGGGSVASGTDTTASTMTSTGAVLGPNPMQTYYGGTKQQWIYTAAELTDLGFVAGSEITSIALDLAAASATPALTALSVKMKNTAQGSFASTTSWITDMTTVRAAANHTPVVGLNTITLDAPFVWDGTSNLAVQMSYSNNSSPSAGTTTAKFSATSFVSTIFYRADNTLPAAMESYTGTASYTYSTRNNVTFTFNNPAEVTWSPITNLYTDAAATTPYVGGTAMTVYTKPTADIIYTATATSGAGCSVSDTAAITINVIDAPTANGQQEFCSGALISDIEVTGTDVQWYNGATGGSVLADTTPLVNGVTYYAAQTVDGCESVARTAVTVEVNTVAAPTADDNIQVFCNTATIDDLEVSGTGIVWYTAPMGGTAVAADTPLEEGISLFFASQTVDGCESATRTAVAAVLNVTDAPMVANDAPIFCNAATIADIEVDGDNIVWYDAETGGTVLDADHALTDGGMYYASQSIDGCESADRTMVMVTINAPVAPQGEAVQSFCDAATLGDIIVDGAAVWYDAAEGGNMLSMDTPVVNLGTYFAAQVVEGCESIERLQVEVIINSAIVDQLESVTVCEEYILPAIENGNYFTDSNGAGQMLLAGDAITETTTIFIYAENGTCTAETTFNVTVAPVAAPSGEAVQVFEVHSPAEVTVEDLVVTTEGVGAVTWYHTAEDAAAGTNPIEAGTQLEEGENYFATFTAGTCTSTSSFEVTVDVVLGREGFDKAGFTFYPNPVKDVLTLTYTSDITSVSVYNLLGQQVMAQQVNAAEGKVDMSGLADGAYIVNVTAGNLVKTIRVIKKQ